MTPAFVYNMFVNSMHGFQMLQNHFVESSEVKLLVSSAVNYYIYPCHNNTNSSRYEQNASGQVSTYRVVTIKQNRHEKTSLKHQFAMSCACCMTTCSSLATFKGSSKKSPKICSHTGDMASHSKKEKR